MTSNPFSRFSNLPPNNYRILISGDNKDFRALLRYAMESEGYVCRTCPLGEELREEILKFRPHLLLTDVYKNGRLYGFEMIKVIKTKLDPQLAIIIISADINQKEQIEQAWALGVDDRVSLPFELDELQQCVRKILKRRKLVPDELEREQGWS